MLLFSGSLQGSSRSKKPFLFQEAHRRPPAGMCTCVPGRVVLKHLRWLKSIVDVEDQDGRFQGYDISNLLAIASNHAERVLLVEPKATRGA